MANVNIPSLTELTSIAVGDLFVVEDVSAGETKKIRADTIMEYGPDVGNGEYVRFYNGVQICWGVVTLAFVNTDLLRDVWTFPAAYSSNPSAWMSIRTLNITPNITYVTLNRSEATTTTGTFTAYRRAGDTSFVSGDTISANVFAVGTWS